MKIKNLNIKKLISLLTTSIMLITPSISKSESNKFTDLDYHLMETITIAQNSDFIKNSGMRYNSKNFWQNGCGPSSIINSLILGLDFGDQNAVIEFSQEVLRIFAIKHKPQERSIKVTEGIALDLDQSDYIIKHKEEFPIMYSLLTQYDGEIEYITKKIKPETVFNKISDGNTLILGKAALQEELSNYLDLAYDLYQRGYYDAEIIINCVQVGKEEWNRPFKTKYGHYCTYYFNVKQLIEEGAFYLIDSLPRALEGEPFGKQEIYTQQYAFVGNKSYKTFNNTFTCERINPTIIKININEIQEFRNITNKQEFINFMISKMKCLDLGGNVGIVISIPNKDKHLYK